MSDSPSAPDAAHRRRILVVMCFALAVVVAAVAMLNVALPDLARETGATQTQQLWIVNAYAVTFAGLLLPAGALGDLVGRRRVLVAGLALFSLGSLAAVFTTAPELLIAERALMGVGAAGIMPVTLSIITTVFPKEERGRAVGIWSGVAGAGGILGLLVAGAILEGFSWEAIFAVNVGAALLALAATVAVVPDSSDPEHTRADPVGSVLSAAGLAAVVYAIIEGPEKGWTSTVPVGAMAGGLLLLVAFVVWELRRENPMLDMRLFRDRAFATGALSVTFQFFVAFGFFVVVLQYLQLELGLSPLVAAVGLLPMGVGLILISPNVDRLVQRFGPGPVGGTGLALLAIAFLVFAQLGQGSSYWLVLAGLLPMGAGMALAGVPATTSIVSGVPPEKQGVASAVNDTARELGGALGIAVLGALLNDRYSARVGEHLTGLPANIAGPARDSLAGALVAADRLGERGARLAAGAQGAFADGLSLSMLTACGVVTIVAVVVAALGPRRTVPETQGPHETRPEPAGAERELSGSRQE